jgi:hypothetical protein
MGNGILAIRVRVFLVLLVVFPLAVYSQSIMVGDIEINPQDFSASLDKESLIAYQAGTRTHKEMSAISAMLDEETINFMAHSFAAYLAPPMKAADYR